MALRLSVSTILSQKSRLSAIVGVIHPQIVSPKASSPKPSLIRIAQERDLRPMGDVHFGLQQDLEMQHISLIASQ